MKIYVGYIITDCVRPLYVSKNKKKIEAILNDYKNICPFCIEEYNLNENNVIDLNCD